MDEDEDEAIGVVIEVVEGHPTWMIGVIVTHAVGLRKAAGDAKGTTGSGWNGWTDMATLTTDATLSETIATLEIANCSGTKLKPELTLPTISHHQEKSHHLPARHQLQALDLFRTVR